MLKLMLGIATLILSHFFGQFLGNTTKVSRLLQPIITLLITLPKAVLAHYLTGDRLTLKTQNAEILQHLSSGFIRKGLRRVTHRIVPLTF